MITERNIGRFIAKATEVRRIEDVVDTEQASQLAESNAKAGATIPESIGQVALHAAIGV